jgi:hypothetical protein
MLVKKFSFAQYRTFVLLSIQPERPYIKQYFVQTLACSNYLICCRSLDWFQALNFVIADFVDARIWREVHRGHLTEADLHESRQDI